MYEYLEVCSSHISNASKLFHNDRFVDQKQMAHNRKNGGRNSVNRLGFVDINGDVRHNLGSWRPSEVEVPSVSLPDTFKEQAASVKLIWLDRPQPKYGLIKIPMGEEFVLAFLSVNAVNSQRYVPHLASILWRNMRNVRVNAKLIDATSQIPYVVTELWISGDKNASWSSPPALKDEWAKVVSLLLADKVTMNVAAAGVVLRLQAEKVLEECTSDRPKPAETVSRTGKLGWITALKGIVGKVEKVLNANYGIACCYQDLPGSGPKRFFVLFDLCDFNDIVAKETAVKSLKESMAPGDSIRLNAVYVDVENAWNLNYLATAVTHIKGNAAPPLMPEKAPCLKDSSECKPEKLQNFSVVMSKIVKKPPPAEKPEDKPVMPNPRNFAEKMNQDRPNYKEQRRQEQTRPSYQSQQPNQRSVEQRRVAERANKQNVDKRNELMKSKPEVYRELKTMEINRGGNFFYDCKPCGIQGMAVEDAEDHITTDSHLQAKAAAPAPAVASRVHLDRTETEEALFLNSNKAISVHEANGRKYYECKDCKVKRLPFVIMKKHVLSQNHKNSSSNTTDSPELDQECKEMRKVGRTGISHFCQPCAFYSDSIIAMKVHLVEKEHARLTALFCHVCKEFMRNRSALSDHRFSIAHKKLNAALEEQCSKPMVKPQRKAAPAPDPKEAADTPPAPPAVDQDNLTCSICDFKGKSSEEFEEHEASASHKRRVYIKTQVMPAGNTNNFDFNGERCTTIEEMCLVREAKDIEERSKREKGVHDSEVLKKDRERLLNNLFDGGVYTQMEEHTVVRCNTCRIILRGKERTLTRQLLGHLVTDKHSNKLRIQIKDEEHTGKDRSTTQREEEEAEEAARAARTPSPEPEAEKAPVPSPTSSEAEILAWLKTQVNMECLMSDRLCYCSTCKTGLKPVREGLKHMLGPVHDKNKEKLESAREWRIYHDIIDIYEHGDGLFKVVHFF